MDTGFTPGILDEPARLRWALPLAFLALGLLAGFAGTRSLDAKQSADCVEIVHRLEKSERNVEQLRAELGHK